MRSNKQSARSLIAFLVTWAFIVLTVSGIVLYIVPQGRIAYWTHWSLFGLEKDQWGWLHMMFGGLFIVTGILHLYFNWKPFKTYLAERVSGHLEMKREVLIASLLTLALAVTSVLNLPPASWVIALNNDIKRAWIDSPDVEPPFGHAEELSLAGLARRQGMDADAALTALREAGLQVPDARASLEHIARSNGVTPMAVFARLPKGERRSPGRQQSWTDQSVEERFSGSGIGRKTLAEVCETLAIELPQCLAKLQAAGVDADADETARQVANRHSLNPIDLVKRLLVAPAG